MSDPQTIRRSEQFKDPEWGAAQLRGVSLFMNITNEELQALYSEGEIQVMRPQSHVVIEGDPTRGLYIILEGTVSVYKNDASKTKMIRLAFLEAGSAFGELSLFDTAPRSATVIAESICSLFHLDYPVFADFLEKHGDSMSARFYKTCAEKMVERFRVQNSDYMIAQELLWKHALRVDRKS